MSTTVFDFPFCNETLISQRKCYHDQSTGSYIYLKHSHTKYIDWTLANEGFSFCQPLRTWGFIENPEKLKTLLTIHLRALVGLESSQTPLLFSIQFEDLDCSKEHFFKLHHRCTSCVYFLENLYDNNEFCSLNSAVRWFFGMSNCQKSDFTFWLFAWLRRNFIPSS